MDRTLHCLTLVTVIFRRNANGRPATRYSPLNPTVKRAYRRRDFSDRPPSECGVAGNDGMTEITTKFSTNYSIVFSPPHFLFMCVSLFSPILLYCHPFSPSPRPPPSLSLSLSHSVPACLAFLYSTRPICPSVPRGKIGSVIFTRYFCSRAGHR